MISSCCRVIRHSKFACTSIADCSGRQATEACVTTPALQEVLPLWLQPPNMATLVQEGQTIDLSKVGIQSTQLQKSVVFVLGGPGSGKGTQCSKLVQEFGLLHLSAGDLLRAHMKSGTPDGTMVAEMIKQGQIVPSHVTISLLQKAMADSKQSKVLIDGFPRNDENRAAYETQTSSEPNFILFFDCPESVMEQRLLGRNEGRTDDNAETIRKRFKVFLESSMPVISHYERKGKVHKFHADRSPEDIYKEVRQLFVPASGL